MAPSKKVFFLDTNVILHDSSCLYRFHEHDIILPIAVLEELDNFKKGNESINYHAREFVRILDSLSGDKLFNGGVRIGPDKGRVAVKLERRMDEALSENFTPQKMDHRILNVAFIYAKEHPKVQTILISKDVNLRLKAKAIGLLAEDYKTDQVKDINTLYRGCRTMQDVDAELIKTLYNVPYEFEAGQLQPESPLVPNEHLILRNSRSSALAYYCDAEQKIKRVDKVPAYGIMPRNAEQTFALNVLMNDDIKLVSLTGKAGTGKTLLALAAALQRRKNYRQILMARPVVPLSNKDIGYLPGDIHEKLEPYMQPLMDNLGVLRMVNNDTEKKRIEKFLEDEKLVIAPLAYIRGRSLVKLYFIVDEAQNLTPHEVKTIISRAGEGTKIVLTGDIFQIDHPYLDSSSNGLSYLIERMQGQPLYAHINLEKGERSDLAELASDLL
ncbi:PhoH family protein [Candidatus Sumerlaeota bacterium]|nr:PhoH family protein [Candidatus Sumerlaeota bacterium]